MKANTWKWIIVVSMCVMWSLISVFILEIRSGWSILSGGVAGGLIMTVVLKFQSAVEGEARKDIIEKLSKYNNDQQP